MMQVAFAFTTLTVTAQMLVVGLSFSRGAVAQLVHDPRALLRAALAILVLVPMAAVMLVSILHLPAEVAAGLAVLAAVPAAPVSTRRSLVAGADTEYVAALQFIMALAAVAFTPLVIAIFRSVLDAPTIRVAPLDVVFQISKMTLAPLLVGTVIQRLAPSFVDRHRATIARSADFMLLALLIGVALAFVFVQQLRADLMIGWTGAAAAALLALAALAGGHLLGGPTQSRRTGLAIASVARNLGLALYITELSPEALAAAPTILAYALIGGAIAMPYSIWTKRRNAIENAETLPTYSPS
jgi:BASS family bile acid:Na+ symporter